MMKQQYEEAVIELLAFEREDVVTISGDIIDGPFDGGFMD